MLNALSAEGIELIHLFAIAQLDFMMIKYQKIAVNVILDVLPAYP